MCTGVLESSDSCAFARALVCHCSRTAHCVRPMFHATACDQCLSWRPVAAFLLQVDNRQSSEPVITPEQAVKLCDRNFGIGGDGVSHAEAFRRGEGGRGRKPTRAAP